MPFPGTDPWRHGSVAREAEALRDRRSPQRSASVLCGMTSETADAAQLVSKPIFHRQKNDVAEQLFWFGL